MSSYPLEKGIYRGVDERIPEVLNTLGTILRAYDVCGNKELSSLLLYWLRVLVGYVFFSRQPNYMPKTEVKQKVPYFATLTSIHLLAAQAEFKLLTLEQWTEFQS